MGKQAASPIKKEAEKEEIFMEWTKELADRFLKTDPATYGHFLGVSFMNHRMKPINKHSKLVGPAYTVKTGRKRFLRTV